MRRPSRPNAEDRTSRDFPETSCRRSANLFADRLALFVLGVVAVLAAATFRDYGLGWDDYTHSQYGDLLLAFYGSGFSDQRALSFVNLYKYGGGFDMAAALAAKVLPFGLFETRRLIGALVGIIGLVATWRIGRRLGGPLTGLVALLLLATCPLYYGHMFMNAEGRALRDRHGASAARHRARVRRISAARAAPSALVGVGLGLAFGSRMLAAIAAPCGLAALGRLSMKPRIRIMRLPRRLGSSSGDRFRRC